MKNAQLSAKLDQEIQVFIQRLKTVYSDDLLSIILYGSAASGEFIEKHSNLNILIVLKSTKLADLRKSSAIVNKFANLTPLFLTEEYIHSSTDIFPIEFLDMQENYYVLYGKDVLKDTAIDVKNLRFQCEQELKAKLINLKQIYIRLNANPRALRELLLKSFTSILHILRNVLRLKGMQPSYKKEELLKELAGHFKIELSPWEKILGAKLKKVKINKAHVEELFVTFIGNLEEIVKTVDAL